MRHQSAFLFFTCVSLVARAQEPVKTPATSPDPREIVRKAAEAMGKANLVSYDLEYRASGFFSAFLPNVTGRVIMGRESPDGFKRFRVTVKVQRGESADATDVSAGADGDLYYLIDDKTKTVHADIDPQVMGKHRDAIDFTLTREFGMARPFEDALKGGEIKYVKEEKVDGHDCDVVHFKSQYSAPAMDWYFSKKDHLPRRTRFAMAGPDGSEGAGEATLHNLTVNPKLDKDPFALVVPEGYKKTADFAP